MSERDVGQSARRLRAAILAVVGAIMTGLALGGILGQHGRSAWAFLVLGPMVLVLGTGGLVWPHLIGKDHELAPGDRPKQVALVVVGLAVGAALLVWRLSQS